MTKKYLVILGLILIKIAPAFASGIESNPASIGKNSPSEVDKQQGEKAAPESKDSKVSPAYYNSQPYLTLIGVDLHFPCYSDVPNPPQAINMLLRDSETDEPIMVTSFGLLGISTDALYGEMILTYAALEPFPQGQFTLVPEPSIDINTVEWSYLFSAYRAGSPECINRERRSSIGEPVNPRSEQRRFAWLNSGQSVFEITSETVSVQLHTRPERLSSEGTLPAPPPLDNGP